MPLGLSAAGRPCPIIHTSKITSTTGTKWYKDLCQHNRQSIACNLVSLYNNDIHRVKLATWNYFLVFRVHYLVAEIDKWVLALVTKALI